MIKAVWEFFYELLKAWATLCGIIVGTLVLGAPLWLFIMGGFWLIAHAK